MFTQKSVAAVLCQVMLPACVLLFAGTNRARAQVADADGTAGKDVGLNEVPAFTCWEVVGKSVFGKADPERPWTPLLTRDFLTEGWNEPWIAPPNGTGGALRQGWVNTFDAFFNRMAVGIYSHTNAAARGQNEDAGSLLFETPLSRRWMVGAFVPVVDSLDAGGGSPSATGFGDLVLENRFILTETQDTTLSFNFNVRTPTGDSRIGANQTWLIPYLAFWQDVGKGASVRGGAGFDVPVDSDPGHHGTIGFVNLAVGQTITPHDAAPLGDFTYYVAMNLSQNLGSSDATSVTLTPGVRTHLGKDWFFLAGVEVPVTGPRTFNERFTFVLVKGF